MCRIRTDAKGYDAPARLELAMADSESAVFPVTPKSNGTVPTERYV